MRRLIYLALGLIILSPAATAQTADGPALWDKIHEVFSHPRCANCHVGEDARPRFSGAHYGFEDGEWGYHSMNIHGGESRIGNETLPCTTCHQEQNSPVLHGPPGNEVWALPPVEMQWFDISSAEICAQIKDRRRNGNRSLREMADHIAEDELVHWGWDPGPGREPAPYSAEEIAADFRAWAAQGAPCPAPAEDEEAQP